MLEAMLMIEAQEEEEAEKKLQQDKKKTIKVFPFYLKSYTAKDLIEQYARFEIEEATRYLIGEQIEFQYIASVSEDKTVELSVWHSFRSGGISGAGTLFSKKIKLSDEQFNFYVKTRKMDLAKEYYYREKEEEERRKIEEMYNRLFPEDM